MFKSSPDNIGADAFCIRRVAALIVGAGIDGLIFDFKSSAIYQVLCIIDPILIFVMDGIYLGNTEAWSCLKQEKGRI